MKHKLLSFAIFSAMALAFFSPGNVSAAVSCPPGTLRNPDDTAKQIDGITSIAQCNIPANETATDGTEKDAMYYVKLVINVVLSIIGLVATAMIIIGGISFITSQGDPAKITKAKSTVLYGVVGLVIALLAFAVINFVLGSIFGGDAGSIEGGSGS